jgi:hypothetical protein
MAITGVPKDLSDRSFLFNDPLFTGIACFYWGGFNTNLLVGRSAAELNIETTPTYSYVNSTISGVVLPKAISGATLKDSLKLVKPTSYNTNDLNGEFNDFTILYYGKLQQAQNGGCLFSIKHSTEDEHITAQAFINDLDPNGTEGNFVLTVKGTAATATHFSNGNLKNTFACYAFRRSGNTLGVLRDGVVLQEGVQTLAGAVSVDGNVLLGRSTEDYGNAQLMRSELSLFVVYKRALSNSEINTLVTNPFTILPSPTVVPPIPSQWRKEAVVYHIGNSVTDAISYTKLKEIAANNQVNYTYGRHMIPGAPLDYIKDNSTSGFSETPYGFFPNALTNYDFNVLTLQPFDRRLDNDVPTIQYFLNLLYGKAGNIDTKILIYSRWARRILVSSNPDVYAPYNFPALWNQAYSGNAGFDNTIETKDYFQKIVLGLRTLFPTKKIFLAPVGDCFLEFDRQAKLGQISGFTQVNELFFDAIHLTDTGNFLVSCVFYSCIFEETPVPLNYVPYGIAEPIATKIKQIVWSVVDKHPYSGVDSSVSPPITLPPSGLGDAVKSPGTRVIENPKSVFDFQS